MNLAKGLIILVIFIAIGAGFYAFSATQSLTPRPTPLASSSPAGSAAGQMSPEETVKGFYTQYEGCLKNYPKAAEGQVGLYCQSHNPFITGTFVANLEQGGVAQAGAEPVFCTQNIPQNIKVGIATAEGNTAKVKVAENFGENIVEPTISLLKESNGWRVDDVICPKPSGSLSASSTDSWETYTNENSKISFKYPVKVGSRSAPVVKTTSTGTQVSVEETGLEFMLIIQPIKPGFPQYYGESKYQETYRVDWVDSIAWDVSVGQLFMAFQTTKNNIQYVFVFLGAKEKTELQQAIASTFKFLD